jgi:hypothetical protein
VPTVLKSGILKLMEPSALVSACNWIALLLMRRNRVLLSNVMEQSPSLEASSSSVSQKFPGILWNTKFHYRVYKCTPPVCIQSQIYPLHAPYLFMNVHINIIFPSMPWFSMWSLSFTLPHQILYAPYSCKLMWIYSML